MGFQDMKLRSMDSSCSALCGVIAFAPSCMSRLASVNR